MPVYSFILLWNRVCTTWSSNPEKTPTILVSSRIFTSRSGWKSFTAPTSLTGAVSFTNAEASEQVAPAATQASTRTREDFTDWVKRKRFCEPQ